MYRVNGNARSRVCPETSAQVTAVAAVPERRRGDDDLASDRWFWCAAAVVPHCCKQRTNGAASFDGARPYLVGLHSVRRPLVNWVPNRDLPGGIDAGANELIRRLS